MDRRDKYFNSLRPRKASLTSLASSVAVPVTKLTGSEKKVVGSLMKGQGLCSQTHEAWDTAFKSIWSHGG